jgi:hypothetical protein
MPSPCSSIPPGKAQNESVIPGYRDSTIKAPAGVVIRAVADMCTDNGPGRPTCARVSVWARRLAVGEASDRSGRWTRSWRPPIDATVTAEGWVVSQFERGSRRSLTSKVPRSSLSTPT